MKSLSSKQKAHDSCDLCNKADIPRVVRTVCRYHIHHWSSLTISIQLVLQVTSAGKDIEWSKGLRGTQSAHRAMGKWDRISPQEPSQRPGKRSDAKFNHNVSTLRNQVRISFSGLSCFYLQLRVRPTVNWGEDLEGFLLAEDLLTILWNQLEVIC